MTENLEYGIGEFKIELERNRLTIYSILDLGTGYLINGSKFVEDVNKNVEFFIDVAYYFINHDNVKFITNLIDKIIETKVERMKKNEGRY